MNVTFYNNYSAFFIYNYINKIIIQIKSQSYTRRVYDHSHVHMLCMYTTVSKTLQRNLILLEFNTPNLFNVRYFSRVPQCGAVIRSI